jgi:hypothetical protein
VQSSRLNEQIRQSVNDAVAGALAPVRAQVQEELATAQAQRESIVLLMKHATTSAQKGSLQEQLNITDARIGKLQADLEKLNRQLTTQDGPPAIPMIPQRPMGTDDFNAAPMVLGIVGTIFIGFPLAIAFARLLWRRASGVAPATPVVSQEQARRFDRLEQSVDAIAIEIERISENQRYLTKLLAEPKQNASVGSGS